MPARPRHDPVSDTDAAANRSAVEAVLQSLLPAMRDRTGRGRPPVIPAAMLWSAMLCCILRQDGSIRGIWRLISATGFWHWARRPVSDDAIYHRLDRDGPGIMQQLFQSITAHLWDTGPQESGLASFASAVVALDTTTLDTMVKKGPHPGGIPRCCPANCRPSSTCGARNSGRSACTTMWWKTRRCPPGRWWKDCPRAV